MRPSKFASLQGISLRSAYQPASDEEALFCYENHRCLACNAIASATSLPDASVLQIERIFFKALPKSCDCGFTNEIFLILNNLLRPTDPKIPKANEAIAQAAEKDLLLDAFLEEQLVASTVAIHQGKLEAAIEINRDLNARFPDFFLPFYNLGVIYTKQQRYSESLEAYEAALRLNPEHSESLVNKALVQMHLSQLQEAGATYEQWRSMNSEGTAVLATAEGMFGKVTVFDTPEIRALCINEQMQGAFDKQPAANEYEPHCRPGPGPLSSLYYTAGFLLVGCHMPRASGLVIGLGCGSGLIMGLACFPEMRLTVVEIDPTVIRLCLTFFPLVQHYINAGRLQIIESDGAAFLQSNEQRFDFINFDVYTGEGEFPTKLRTVEFIKRIKASASLLFINIIGSLSEPYLHRVLATFDAAGQPIHTLYHCLPLEGNETNPMNWLAFTQALTVPDDFIPFADLTGEQIETVRHNFSSVRQNGISPARVRTYIEQIGLHVEPYRD
ncbi:protein arginine N-methyltransferase [Microcoleus sp. ZQ-A2]|nr:tetratricopeptide repeat protein [Microcoleus sp. FACHB-1]